jgi:hypothetical protein
MAELKKEQVIDVNGSEIVSTALLKLLNEFPGLDGKRIKFSTLEDKSGIGFFPTSGAVLISHVKSITGHVAQECAYPFNVLYRAAPKTEQQKLRIKEFLDMLGKWLEQQPITVNGENSQLHEYPKLDEGRVIKSINRTSPGHLNGVYQDGVEDWLVSVTLRYTYEYDE